jgi:hypothetical protein
MKGKNMTELAIKKYNNKREKILGFAQELINKENDQEKIKKIYELALFIQKNTSFKYTEKEIA